MREFNVTGICVPDDYICASISFQYSDDDMFAGAEGFCQELLSRIHYSL